MPFLFLSMHLLTSMCGSTWLNISLLPSIHTQKIVGYTLHTNIAFYLEAWISSLLIDKIYVLRIVWKAFERIVWKAFERIDLKAFQKSLLKRAGTCSASTVHVTVPFTSTFMHISYPASFRNSFSFFGAVFAFFHLFSNSMYVYVNSLPGCTHILSPWYIWQTYVFNHLSLR